jgi:exosortase
MINVRTQWRTFSPAARLGVLLAFSVLFWWQPLLSTFGLSVKSNEYTHLLLIVPISLSFIYMSWNSARRFVSSGSALGLTILSAAVVMVTVAEFGSISMTPDLRLSLEMLALVAWWIGSFILCFGTKASRALLFPLCFLFWMVPLPEFALTAVIKFLQDGSALISTLLFQAARVPVLQNGVHLFIPGLTIEIAKECSSIRSSLMLLVTTMVLAQLFLRSPIKKALVIAIALPLSIAKNGLRIFVIAMLGTRVDPGYLNGRFHHQGGIVFFAIALVFIFLLLWLLQRGESRQTTKPAVDALVSC